MNHINYTWDTRKGFFSKVQDISFKAVSKYLLAYASDTNPWNYAIAGLHGCGLRDED